MSEQPKETDQNDLAGEEVADSGHQEMRQEGNFIQRLKDSLSARNSQEILDLLMEIDRALVAEVPDVIRMASLAGWTQELEELFNDMESGSIASAIFYLSDGGTSRLSITWINEHDIEIFPTSNSTDEVKQAWEKLK